MRDDTHSLTIPQILTCIATAAALTITWQRAPFTPAAWASFAPLLLIGTQLHNIACSHITTWDVYGLYDKRGDIIYVGSTNSVERRAVEHVEDTTEQWKRHVACIQVVRCCQSEKQARRIEERRIKALTRAVEKNWVKVLHNDLHTRPADTSAVRAWRLMWALLYRAEQFLNPTIRWVGNPWPHIINPPDTDDDTLYDTQPPPVDPDQDAPPRHRRHAAEATYERTQRNTPGPGPSSHRPLLELVPGPLSPCPRHTTPVGGAPMGEGTGDTGNQHVRGQGTLADRIREASARHADTVTRKRSKKPDREPAGPKLTAEESDAKRRWDEREKKRRQRAKQAGQEYRKQPWPGDLPA